MAQPQGEWLVNVLRTAKSWGRRPTEVLHAPNPGHWCVMDSLLSGALDLYERTQVGALGFPKRLTEGDYEGHFEVKTRQDNAQLALDVWEKRQREQLQPGEVPYVVFTGD